MRRKIFAAVLTLLASSASCTPRAQNLELDQGDEESGYRFEAIGRGESNSDETFVFLSFSGGGTRAAALAYGVLQGLEEVDLGDRTLLDEVDMISSVSGGSFTAMAYGLWGKEMFDGRFEDRFLRRNVIFDLVLQVLNPLNWLSLPIPVYDSIDVAAMYYNKRIFDESTYADLIERDRRPFIEINASDVTRKQTFGFTQDEFDLLGSDLASLSVGWAVAASSAFPVILSPVRLHYYPGEVMQTAIQRELDTPGDVLESRRRKWAESLAALQEAAPEDEKPEVALPRFLYLMDGGISDNLGLHAFLREFRVGSIRKRMESGEIKRLIVVIVDAATEKPTNLEQRVFAPGWLTSLVTTLNSGVENNSRLTSAVVRYLVEEDFPDLVPKRAPDLHSIVIDVDLRSAPDPTLRERLMGMATSFVLPQGDVTVLIEHGKKLVVENEKVNQLRR
ncbi:MAG: patatin-like phospholipase family protein [Planctomycetota bacterium]|jgi:predicted acylesterase/phospholipase RssA